MRLYFCDNSAYALLHKSIREHPKIEEKGLQQYDEIDTLGIEQTSTEWQASQKKNLESLRPKFFKNSDSNYHIESHDDGRGLVASSRQEHLEQRWISLFFLGTGLDQA